MKDNSRAEIATKDADAAVLYAECQAKHKNVVDTLDQIVAAVNRYVEELRAKALPAQQDKKR